MRLEGVRAPAHASWGIGITRAPNPRHGPIRRRREDSRSAPVRAGPRRASTKAHELQSNNPWAKKTPIAGGSLTLIRFSRPAHPASRQRLRHRRQGP